MATSTAPRHPFRQHEDARGLRSPLLRQLCQEWAELNASSRAAEDLDRWSSEHTALDGLGTLGEVVDYIDRASKREKDAAVRALLTLLQQGEQLAGRILLQALLPCITDLVRRCLHPRGVTSYEENLQRALVEFWAVISRPRELTRPGVAARLWLDTLKQLTSHRRNHDAWEAAESYPAPIREQPTGSAWDENAGQVYHRLHLVTEDQVQVVGDIAPDGGLYELLLTARRAGALSEAEAQFLAEVYLSPDPKQTLAEAAARLGLTAAAVRKRCSRLKDRLVDVVLADLATDLAQVTSHG